MNLQNKAGRVAKMIEEMMDIKLRQHDREHHFKGDDKKHVAELHNSLADQNQLHASRATLSGAIADLITAS
jgi:hypothetical protein